MVKKNVLLSKIISAKSPPYLYELIPPLQRSHRYPGPEIEKLNHIELYLFSSV